MLRLLSLDAAQLRWMSIQITLCPNARHANFLADNWY